MTLLSQFGWTILMLACFRGHIDVVRMLLEKTYNIDRQDETASPTLLVIHSTLID
jgi:ankyrin repeat protein